MPPNGSFLWNRPNPLEGLEGFVDRVPRRVLPPPRPPPEIELFQRTLQRRNEFLFREIQRRIARGILRFNRIMRQTSADVVHFTWNTHRDDLESSPLRLGLYDILRRPLVPDALRSSWRFCGSRQTLLRSSGMVSTDVSSRLWIWNLVCLTTIQSDIQSFQFLAWGLIILPRIVIRSATSSFWYHHGVAEGFAISTVIMCSL